MTTGGATTASASQSSLSLPPLDHNNNHNNASSSDKDESSFPASRFSPIPIVMSRGDSSLGGGSFDSIGGAANPEFFTRNSSGDSSADEDKIVLQANHQHRLSARKISREDSGVGGGEADPFGSERSLGGGADGTGTTTESVPKALLAPLSGAWGWIQKQKEKHKQQHLKQLAEQQMQKLKEAQMHDPNLNHFMVEAEDSTNGYSETNNGVATNTAPQHLFQSSSQEQAKEEEEEDDISWIPPVRCVEETVNIEFPPSPRSSRTEGSFSGGGAGDPTKPVPFLLDAAQMHDIARYVLPKGIAFCRWKRLYSLTRDGDSFFQCLRLCGAEPKTLMVIKTTRGAIFGGYADSVWEIQSHQNGNFHGSAQACLFSFAIAPTANGNNDNNNHKNNSNNNTTNTNIRVFPWTGANRYIQYTDKSEHKRMFAFGGGGQEGAFGLCVEQDFQLGSTGHCDTFDNLPLCDQENFNILDLEIWGFLTGQF